MCNCSVKCRAIFHLAKSAFPPALAGYRIFLRRMARQEPLAVRDASIETFMLSSF